MYPTAQDGATAALSIQRTLREYNGDTPDDSRIILKIGLSEGEAVHTGLQLFGSAWDEAEELGEELGGKRQVRPIITTITALLFHVCRPTGCVIHSLLVFSCSCRRCS